MEKLMKTLIYGGSAIVTYFQPIFSLFWIVLAAILIDLITGFAAYCKKNPIDVTKSKWSQFKQRCGQFKSKLFRRSGIKFVCYLAFIGLSYAVSLEILGNDYIAKAAFGIFMMVELVSIAENMGAISSKSAFAKIVSFFTSKITDKVNEKISGSDGK